MPPTKKPGPPPMPPTTDPELEATDQRLADLTAAVNRLSGRVRAGRVLRSIIIGLIILSLFNQYRLWDDQRDRARQQCLTGNIIRGEIKNGIVEAVVIAGADGTAAAEFREKLDERINSDRECE